MEAQVFSTIYYRRFLHYSNNSFNYMNYRIVKNIKVIKSALTYSGSRRIYHQGAEVSA